MLRVAVMHSASSPPLIARQIMSKARELGAKVKYIRVQDASVVLEGDSAKVYIGSSPLEAELVFVRGVGGPQSVEEHVFKFDVVKALEDQGTLTINSYESIIRARDKLRTLMLLKGRGIPVPETLVTTSLDAALHFTQRWGRVVVKPIVGSLGRGVMLLDDVDIAYSVYRQLLSWHQPLLIQKYYEKRGNRDLRVLVVDEEVVASYYRVAREGLFKTNLAQGARVEPAEKDPETLELAVRATEALGLFYAGVDVMEADGRLFVLEVNASPNWKGALQLGIDPSDKLVRKAFERVRR